MSWKMVSLGEYGIDLVDGDRGVNYPKQEDFSEIGYCLFLNTKNVTKTGFFFENRKFITSQKDSLLRKGKLKRNDIVLTTRGTIGNVGLYKNSVEYENIRINSGMLIIRPDSSIFFTEYLYWFLKSQTTQNKLKDISSGCAQPQLPIRSLINLKIPLPPLDVQKKIAAVLEKADRLRQLRQKQIEKLDLLLQSVFLDMFGDPVTNPKGWEVKKLGNVCDDSPMNGYFKKNDCYGKGTPIIWINNFINKFYSDIQELRLVEASQTDIQKYRVEYGDVLFCRSSLTKEGIGKAGIIPADINGEILFECHIIKQHLNTNTVIPEFFRVLSDVPYFRNQVISHSKTSTMTTISQQGISSAQIIIPPMEIQSRFYKIQQKITKEKRKMLDSQKNIDSLFNSFMHKAFKGDLNINVIEQVESL